MKNSTSNLGYLDNSPYRYNPYNIINTPNGLITMNGVSTPLMAFSELGESKYMPPNSGLHKFGGNRILEIPVAQNGGNIKKLLEQIKVQQYRPATESTAVQFYDPLTKKIVNTATSGVSKEQLQAEANAKRFAKNKEIEAEKRRIAIRNQNAQARQAAIKGDKSKTVILPNGQEKKYSDLDNREYLSVVGDNLNQLFRFNKNEDTWYDDYINPLNWIGSMAGSLGKASLEAKESNSILPYVTSVGVPLAAGLVGKFGVRNTKQWVNNLVNPLPINPLKIESKFLRSVVRPTTEQEVKALKNLKSDLSSYNEYKNLIKDGEGWKISLKDYKTLNPIIENVETSLLTNLSKDGNTYISNNFPKKLTKYRDSELFYGTYPSRYNPYTTLNNESLYRIDFQDYIHDRKLKTAEDILNAGKKDAYNYFNSSYKKYTPDITDVVLRQNKSGGKIVYQKGVINTTIPKKQDGGRLVYKVPEGYLPLPNKPNYYYKTTNKDILSQDNLAGQKASNEEWVKFLNTPKGKLWKENQQNTDIVYIQTNQPVKSFDGQLVYKLDNKPAGMYRWKTRDGQILSSNNGQLNDNVVEWSDVDMYGKPTGGILTIPGDIFSNKITKGVNRLYDESLLNTYRTAPTLEKGGILRKYQGTGTSFIGPRNQNWLSTLNMYDTDIKPELWKEASSLNNTEFEKESPVKVPSNLLLKDGESLEQREARLNKKDSDLNKKDSDFDYWGTGLNTILAANGLLRWASNNKVEGEKYQNYLNQVHDDDSFNTVYSNMSKDYGNDSYRTLRKGGKLKKYQDGGDDSYDEEDDEVISLLFDDKEESSSSEKNKITESDINNQRKLLKKERKKLLEQQEEIENNTIINEIISQQSRKSNYYGEEEGGGGNFPSSSLEKAQVYKNYLIENHGLSNEQASGFLGNLYAESSLNPSIINPTSGAFGLAQWLGSRKKSLLKFAKDNGKDVNDPFLQLDFAVRELNTAHKNSHLDYNSPKSATVGYLNKFEKPSEEEKRKSFAKRVNFANSIYQQGGTYDLSLDEVQSLINQGYKIKHL